VKLIKTSILRTTLVGEMYRYDLVKRMLSGRCRPISVENVFVCGLLFVISVFLRISCERKELDSSVSLPVTYPVILYDSKFEAKHHHVACPSSQDQQGKEPFSGHSLLVENYRIREQTLSI